MIGCLVVFFLVLKLGGTIEEKKHREPSSFLTVIILEIIVIFVTVIILEIIIIFVLVIILEMI